MTIHNGTPCVLWQGAVQSGGYGSTTNGKGGTMLAHRKAWEEANGPIPDGLTVDHLCRVRRCQNTAHMELVTLAENSRRALAAKTHCKHGHPLSGDNLSLVKRSTGLTYRVCVTCRRETAMRAYYDKKSRGEDPNAKFKARRSAKRRAAREEKARLEAMADGTANVA